MATWGKGRTRRSRSRFAARRALVARAAGLAALAVSMTLAPGSLDRLTLLVFDLYQQIRPRVEGPVPVVVVDIDETSIAELGQWPWPRTVMARLVDRLGELGAAAIAFDVVFPEPDRMSTARALERLEAAGAKVDLPAGTARRDSDEVFATSIAANPVVAGLVLTGENENRLPPPKAGTSFAGADPVDYLPDYSGGIANLPILTEAAAGLGFFSFPRTSDGIVRRLPLVASAQGALYPALGLEALRVAQGAGAVIVRSEGEAGRGRGVVTAVRTGVYDVPTGPSGGVWVYYSQLPSMPTVSAADLLDEARDLRSEITGRIVLVGTSAVGLRDLVATPVDEAMPGVRVHAEMIDQIVSGTYLVRPDWALGAELAAAVVAGLVLVAAVGSGAVLSVVAALVLLGAIVAMSWGSFAMAGVLLDPLLPSLAVAAVFTVSTPLLLLMTDREGRFVRQAFSRYLSPPLVERLASDPAALKLGGAERELTILFSDIRGFTRLSEEMPPEALTTLLNRLLTPLTDTLLRSGATIDKYIGDAVMAFWNAPLAQDGHPEAACRAALAMLEDVERLNADGDRQLKIGIGLHTGTACVGNLGSDQRFSYSAIGDTVNLASRVEGLTKRYDVPILVTGPTASEAGDLALLEIDLVRVAGRDAPVPVFALLGAEDLAASPAFRKFAEAHARLLAALRTGDVKGGKMALADARCENFGALAAVYRMYAERLEEMGRNPPGPGWDGVMEAREK